MKGLVSYIDGMNFRCTANNNEIFLDDGTSLMSPMHTILLAIATCTSMDIVHILKKKRQPVEKFEVNVEGNRNNTYPKIFNTITLEYVFWGNLDENACKEAIKLSLQKYCSVSNMLKEEVNISTSIKIIK